MAMIEFSRIVYTIYMYIQGGFFDWSALKMTKCQPNREFSELVLSKKLLRIKKVEVPELVLETVQILKFV